MESSIVYILVILCICLGVYFLIKKVCYPIKTSKAIMLVLPTIASCGIVLIIYKLSKGVYSSKSNYSSDYDYPIYEEEKKEKESTKVSSSYTDNFGNTTYYDEVGNVVARGKSNVFGESVVTDNDGNYVGSSFNHGNGRTSYMDKDGNVVNSSLTNQSGEEVFNDGGVAKGDDFGNKRY